jgi:hypothetical protein
LESAFRARDWVPIEANFQARTNVYIWETAISAVDEWRSVMATSNLLRTGEKGPVTTKGHGTGALGPSDTSDSGSDIRGGPGVVEDSELGLDSGTSSDPGGGSHRTAGPDIGDYNLDADSDSQGTGERLGAGRDAVIRENNDIFPDHVVGPDGETTSLTGSELADEVDEVTNQTDVEFGPREVPRPRARAKKRPAKARSAKTK